MEYCVNCGEWLGEISDDHYCLECQAELRDADQPSARLDVQMSEALCDLHWYSWNGRKDWICDNCGRKLGGIDHRKPSPTLMIPGRYPKQVITCLLGGK